MHYIIENPFKYIRLFLNEDGIFATPSCLNNGEFTVINSKLFEWEEEEKRYMEMAEKVVLDNIREEFWMPVPIPLKMELVDLLPPEGWIEVPALVVSLPPNWRFNPYQWYGFAPAVNYDSQIARIHRNSFNETGELIWA